MKNIFLLLAFATLTSTFGQGIITFYNNNLVDPTTGQVYRAGIFRDNQVGIGDPKGDSTIGAGEGYTAGLFLAGSVTPLATTTFRTTTATEVFATSQDVIIPGHPPGTTANLVIKVWPTALGTYENAVRIEFALGGPDEDPTVQTGERGFTSKALGGPNPNPPPPAFFTPDLAPFAGFELEDGVGSPEPRTFALGALGLIAILACRRKAAVSANAKKSIFAIAFLTLASAHGQGTITFYNNNLINPSTGVAYRAGIFRDEFILPGGGDSTVGAGAGFTAGLFLQGSTTPLATTLFRTTTATEVFAITQDVVVPGYLPGTQAPLVVRAWSTFAGSFENAKVMPDALWGEQAFLSKPLGGPNSNPPPPAFFTPDMAPFTGFVLTIPEPGAGALAGIGLIALMIWGRKSARGFAVKKLVAVAALLSLVSAHGQGIITFYNNNLVNPTTGATYRAGIFVDYGIFGGGIVGAGAGFTAGLFLAGSTTPLATTTFRTTTATEVFATTQDVTIPGVAPGATANLVVKAWNTSAGSYENAAVTGGRFWEQAFTSKPLGGPNPNPPPPAFFTPDMAPFTGFVIPILPEPPTFALAGMGACGLWFARRRGSRL